MKLYFTILISFLAHLTIEAFTLLNHLSHFPSVRGSSCCHSTSSNPLFQQKGELTTLLLRTHNSNDMVTDTIATDTMSSSSTSSTSSTSTSSSTAVTNRRKALSFLFTTTTAVATLPSEKALALVKGNAPPPPKKLSSNEERKCRNVEECQEMAERLAKKQDEEAKANMTPPSITARGTRYRDVVEATTPSENGSKSLQIAKEGDRATIYFKVLKLGKRSYDGLSGEGTVVFSRGYGLEDDETKPGDKNFQFVIGDNQVIAALNDAIIGQAIGSTRRFSVLPQMGWELATKACDGGPGGSGSGGDLKTDYAVVPTAKMVDQEACFDKSKLPFPSLYAEQRRMAQRFDQSLLMEVELVSLD